MSQDVKTFIVLTFTVIIIAWVLVKSNNAATVLNASATDYGTAAKALLPSG